MPVLLHCNTLPAPLTAARHFLARGSPWNMPSSGLTSMRTCMGVVGGALTCQ